MYYCSCCLLTRFCSNFITIPSTNNTSQLFSKLVQRSIQNIIILVFVDLGSRSYCLIERNSEAYLSHILQNYKKNRTQKTSHILLFVSKLYKAG